MNSITTPGSSRATRESRYSVALPPPESRYSVASYFDVTRASAARCTTVEGDAEASKTTTITEAGASIAASTINMVNTILGTGLLALPSVYAGAGFVTGTLIVLLFGALSVFTNYIFVECALKLGRPTSFRSVANAAFDGASIFIDLAVIINSLGGTISYIIVATDGFATVFGAERFVWTLVAFAIAAPLAFLRNMDSLRVTSLLAVVAIAYITFVIVFYLVGSQLAPDDSILDPCPSSSASPSSCPPGETTAVSSFMGNLGACASLGLAFSALQSTPPIFNEIVTPTRNAMLRVGCVAFSAATLLYLLVGVSGYATFGDAVEANILNSYPNTPIVAVARIGLSLVTIFSFPIQVLVMRISGLSLWEYVEERCCCNRSGPTHGEPTEGADGASAAASTADEPAPLTGCSKLFTSDFRGLVVTTCAVLPALIVALITSDVGVVFNLTGAVGGSLVIFIFPSLLYYKHFPELGCSATRVLALACFVLGWVLMGLGIVTTFV